MMFLRLHVNASRIKTLQFGIIFLNRLLFLETVYLHARIFDSSDIIIIINIIIIIIVIYYI